MIITQAEVTDALARTTIALGYIDGHSDGMETQHCRLAAIECCALRLGEVEGDCIDTEIKYLLGTAAMAILALASAIAQNGGRVKH